MLSNSNFITLNKLAERVVSHYPDIRSTEKYINVKSKYLNEIKNYSKSKAILSLEKYMIDARVNENREYFVAAFDIYCRVVGVLSEELIKKISKQHQLGIGDIKWNDIYISEEFMVWDMLRVHSSPELSEYPTVRGYGYINSFKKYFLLYKCLTEKQMNILKSYLFLEIAYNLYCNKCKDFRNNKVHCSILNNLLQSQYVINSSEVSNLFDLIGNYDVDSITIYDDGSDYVLLVEDYIPGDSETPSDVDEHSYIVNSDTLEIFDDDGKFKNLQKIVLSLIDIASKYIGPVDIIRVEKGSKYKGYVGLATPVKGFTEFLSYDTESERKGLQTSFVIM